VIGICHGRTVQSALMDRYRTPWQELLSCNILAVPLDAASGILINVNGTIDRSSLQSHLTGRVITRVDLFFLPARCRTLELIMSRGEWRCAGGQGGSIYITPNMKETSPEELKENQANGLLLGLTPSLPPPSVKLEQAWAYLQKGAVSRDGKFF
jgi:hypothetical protein